MVTSLTNDVTDYATVTYLLNTPAYIPTSDTVPQHSINTDIYTTDRNNGHRASSVFQDLLNSTERTLTETFGNLKERDISSVSNNGLDKAAEHAVLHKEIGAIWASEDYNVASAFRGSGDEGNTAITQSLVHSGLALATGKEGFSPASSSDGQQVLFQLFNTR